MNNAGYRVLLLCAADAGIIPSMRHTWTLIGLLAGLCLIGANTTQLIPAAGLDGKRQNITSPHYS